MVEEAGRLDILINNAAGNFLVRAEELTPNGFDAVVGIVLHGSAYCSMAAGRHMLHHGSGKILSTVASYAWVGGPYTVHSAAAKAGVIAMTKTLAVEWGPGNVQVNALCPGFVDTEQSREVLWGRRGTASNGSCVGSRPAGSAPSRRSPTPGSTCARRRPTTSPARR